MSYIQIPRTRDIRFYSLTGALPGQLLDTEGQVIPFFRVLDVSLSGLGIEMENYMEPGTPVFLKLLNEQIAFEIIYSLYLPHKEAYRNGIKVCDRNQNVVKIFLENNCFHLVPIDEDLFFKLLRKSSQ